MKRTQDLIIEMFQRSVFGLTFEAEEALGYRSESGALRALSIDLKQQKVEYELTRQGLPTKRRVEYSASMDQLIKKLPLTIKSFDLKFEGLRVTDLGATVAKAETHLTRDRRADPWDLTTYFDKPIPDKLKSGSRLKLSDE